MEDFMMSSRRRAAAAGGGGGNGETSGLGGGGGGVCPVASSSSSAAAAALTGKDSGVVKQCRICLEEDGDDFIAPCACKGTQRYVHRSCLDTWRQTREGMAFSKCMECKTPYKLRFPKESKDERYRTWKYRMLVARDTLIVIAALLSVVALLSLGAGIVDAYAGAPLRGSTSTWWKHHTVALYSSVGVLILLAVLGIVGCIASLVRVPGGNGGPPFIPTMHPILFVDCLDSSTIAAGAGEGAPVLLLVAIIAFALLTVVGVFYGVVFAAILMQRITRRHYGVLRKRLLTQDFIVVDLDEIDVEDPSSGRNDTLPEYQRQRLKALGLM